MKPLLTKFLLLWLLACSAPLAAQDPADAATDNAGEAAAEPAADASAVQATEGADTPSGDPGAETESDPGALVEEDARVAASAEDEFNPDEEISEDYPVPLPSDI